MTMMARVGSRNGWGRASLLNHLLLVVLLICLAHYTAAQGVSSTTNNLGSSTQSASQTPSSSASASLSGLSNGPTPVFTTETVKDGGSSVLTTSTLPTGVSTIDGQPPPTTSASPRDPLLAIMPEFAFSMPAQVVVAGVDLALVIMLTIQLVFTIRYHYPLSKRNYCLQSVSTLMLLITFAVHLHVVLSMLATQSHSWPYMFEYIAVQIPPQDGQWDTVQEAFYLLMRAITAFLVHLTHIQFLTLLFPSALEARLILWMLGPLALAASGMEFTALSADDDVKTSDLGDAIRNICNSTLFLLYGLGLMIWGLLVNRRRAWRTDGGTAAFGGGALGLAAINTMISFVEIAFDRLWWLPDICWTLTVWQSWLGFWWWVGAGMGIGEVEDRAERHQRKLKRMEKARRKREREEKARIKILNGGTTGAGSAAVAVAASLGGNSSDAIKGGIRRIRQRFNGTEGSVLNRRVNTQASSGDDRADNDGTGAEDDDRYLREDTLQSVAVERADDNQTVAGSGSHSSDTNPTTSGGGGTTSGNAGWLGSITDFVGAHQPNFIRRRMRRLRLAHVAAAKRAATEQTALRDQVLSRQSAPQGPGLRTMVLENRNAPTMSPSLDEAQRASHSPSARSPRMANEPLDMATARAIYQRRSGRREGSNSGHADASRGNPSRRNAASDLNDEHIDEERERNERENEEDAEYLDDGDDVDGDDDQDEDDAASHQAAAGDQSGTNSIGESSWSLRGGLRGLRMRDHTTYD